VRIDYVLDDFADTPEGTLQKNVKAIFAEYERTKITWRNARGRRAKARSGQVVRCGRTAYGYRVVQAGGETTLAVNDAQARIVRSIFQWYVGEGGKRMSARAIARKLGRMEVPTWGDLHPGKSNKQRQRYV
jgi:site-specific DNA recombinase